MGALYIHIPFCLSKCFYCSFSSIPAAFHLYDPYIAALRKELSELALNYPTFRLKTLFLGGGTPTVLPVKQLIGIVRYCREVFNEDNEVEISIEANPGTVSLEYLDILRAAGVNRISFGVQSFNNRELKDIGRLHDGDEAFFVLDLAMQAGFNNISVDLMYGLPGQSVDSWRYSLQKALNTGVKHLSLYQLTVESGTVFFQRQENNELLLPGEEDVLQMDEVTSELCEGAGLQRYEISNYAVSGYECKHNLNYWFNNEYLAAGAAAVSYMDGKREKRQQNPRQYIDCINNNSSVILEKECLSMEASFRETVIMGLRLVNGVSRRRLFERFGIDVERYYGHTLIDLAKYGLIEVSATTLRITDKGRPLSNHVMAELV